MELFEVTFDYFSDGESGNDKFKFTSALEAQEKFDEYKNVIEQELGQCTNRDTIEDADTFGIMDVDSGSWAKVYITRKTN